MSAAEQQLGTVIAAAAVVPLLLLLVFVLRTLAWARTGSWRAVVALAALASVMFIAAEGIVVAQRARAAVDPLHQLPLFTGVLAAAAAAMIAYLEVARAAERSRRLAMLDPLTGLRNRRAFEEALAVAYEGMRPFSIVFIDLDRFKRINDLLGHDAGDEALRAAAAALGRAVRGADTVARLGGDEFALLLEDADASSAVLVANRAVDGLRSVARARAEWSGLSGSFGIATRGSATSARALLDRADRAMYTAKRAGGDRIALAGT